MIALLAIPPLVGLVLCMAAGRLSESLRPSVAVRLLTYLALSVALCTGIVLSVAAVLAVVQLGPLPRLGRWSVSALRSGMGFPEFIGLLCAPLVVLALVSALVRAARAIRTFACTARVAKDLHPLTGSLVVVDDPAPVAYSVTGPPGRIVVSSALLGLLSAGERRVLLAHESSHLRNRHHLYVNLAQLASAANPLLRPVELAVSRAVERAADEDAANEVGDRSLAARALARAALAGAGHPVPAAALGATHARVAERVQSLLAPPLRYRHLPVALVLAAGVASWLAATAFAAWGDNLVQLAEAGYLPH